MSFVRLLRSHSLGVSVPVYRKCIFHSLTGKTRCRFGSHLPTSSSCAALLACRPPIFNSLHPHRKHTHTAIIIATLVATAALLARPVAILVFNSLECNFQSFVLVAFQCVCVCTPVHRSIDYIWLWLRWRDETHNIDERWTFCFVKLKVMFWNFLDRI